MNGRCCLIIGKSGRRLIVVDGRFVRAREVGVGISASGNDGFVVKSVHCAGTNPVICT